MSSKIKIVPVGKVCAKNKGCLVKKGEFFNWKGHLFKNHIEESHLGQFTEAQYYNEPKRERKNSMRCMHKK